MAELNDVREFNQAYLARDPSGGTIHAGWTEIQNTARTVFEMCGQRTRTHYHAHGDPCNERCDVFPPLPQESPSPAPVVSKPIETTVCSHGVGFDRDCGQCVEEVRLGVRKLRRLAWGGPGEREQ